MFAIRVILEMDSHGTNKNTNPKPEVHRDTKARGVCLL